MTRLKLPIGIQTFREIREEACYYADKTGFALRLIEQGKYYFLSRSRRFGKSLFVDTIAELFAGNEALFQGLYAQDHWDWSTRYPVIRFSFGGGVVRNPAQLEEKIREQLDLNQAQLGLDCRRSSIDGCFAEYEGYYASVFYAYFASLGLDIVTEESSNAGRLDMALRFNGQVYLFEFKVVELAPEGRALQQIKDRGYADKYRGDGQPIYLIGIEFSRERRGLLGFEVERL